MLISKDEINKSIIKKGWNHENKKIIKSYNFKNFSESIEFINKISEICESINHHPEIEIKQSNVKIAIYSIDFDGITTKCINLALKIDSIYITN
tara:strand:+ start:555 stop:836 length:282 start_codon:yes stop_codon:yes gene_type:complete